MGEVYFACVNLCNVTPDERAKQDGIPKVKIIFWNISPAQYDELEARFTEKYDGHGLRLEYQNDALSTYVFYMPASNTKEIKVFLNEWDAKGIKFVTSPDSYDRFDATAGELCAMIDYAAGRAVSRRETNQAGSRGL